MSSQSNQCEQLVCDITGGTRPKSQSLRSVSARVLRVKRSVVDVVSGNDTPLEVKWSGDSRTYQWGWDVRDELLNHDYDRIILVGADYTDDFRYIFDVPKRWILAWDIPVISCSYVPVKPSDINYALHNWFACTREQLTLRYGPGKVCPAETWTQEQEEMLHYYERARDRKAFDRQFSSGASIIDFIIKKFRAGSPFNTVDREIIQAMPQAAWDAIEAKIGSAALRALRPGAVPNSRTETFRRNNG